MKIYSQEMHLTKLLSPTKTGYVVDNFLCQLIFIFPLFLGLAMHVNEFETKEN